EIGIEAAAPAVACSNCQSIAGARREAQRALAIRIQAHKLQSSGPCRNCERQTYSQNAGGSKSAASHRNPPLLPSPLSRSAVWHKTAVEKWRADKTTKLDVLQRSSVVVLMARLWPSSNAPPGRAVQKSMNH